MTTNLSPTPQSTNNRKATRLSLIVVVVLVVIVIGLGLALVQTNATQLVSSAAPDFTLNLFDGQSFTLSKQRGNVVVLNFWASWCGPCRAEAPELNTIWTEYKDRGVVMLGVDYLDNESDARRFLKDFNIQYRVGSDGESKISNDYRIKGVPETYIVDRQGNLAITIPAPTTASALRQVLDRLLTH